MSESFWWCYRCQARVDSAHVTFSEHHDGCGGGCEVLDDEPDVSAALAPFTDSAEVRSDGE